MEVIHVEHYDHTKWACEAAQDLKDKFSNGLAVDTSTYNLCSFILTAAEVALRNPTFAAEIGKLMDPPRVVLP